MLHRSLLCPLAARASARSMKVVPSPRFNSTIDHGIRTLGVVGSGQMGLGIAFVAAKVQHSHFESTAPPISHTAGVQVLITDNSELQLRNGLAFMVKLLEKDVKKERLTEKEAREVMQRVTTVSSVEGLAGVDIAIEVCTCSPRLSEFPVDSMHLRFQAVSESLPLKQKIFAQLATHLSPTAILASNTSSISLSKIAASAIPLSSNATSASLESASRVVGFHFFNPVPVMKLVELIPALQTSNSVLERARSFAVAMGKTVTVSTDTPGFVSNRLLMPFINEAILALEHGVASKEDIDTTLSLGMGHPMGPLVIFLPTSAQFGSVPDPCDRVAAAGGFYWARHMSEYSTNAHETGDSKYRPSVLLGRMVAAGWMGKKSGKGQSLGALSHRANTYKSLVAATRWGCAGFYDY
ncbi:hypothetical protein P7C70_g649, partial [Phenoliferia sp. Uapishka_3]